MARNSKMSNEGAELLKAVEQMKKGKKGRVYSEEQLLAISARKSANLTQRQFAESSMFLLMQCKTGNKEDALRAAQPRHS